MRKREIEREKERLINVFRSNIRWKSMNVWLCNGYTHTDRMVYCKWMNTKRITVLAKHRQIVHWYKLYRCNRIYWHRHRTKYIFFCLLLFYVDGNFVHTTFTYLIWIAILFERLLLWTIRNMEPYITLMLLKHLWKYIGIMEMTVFEM